MADMIDTGLRSLVILAKSFQIPVDLQQLERGYSLETGEVDENTILKAAHDLHLRASCREGVSVERLAKRISPVGLSFTTLAFPWTPCWQNRRNCMEILRAR